MELTGWIGDAWWSYVVVAGVIAGSALFPPLPSETMLVTAAGLALAGELEPASVAIAAVVGASGGDALAYLVGWVAAGRRPPRAGGRIAAAVDWMRRRNGVWWPALIAAGRFVPGGTTAVGLACGALRYPRRTFATWVLLGATVWVGYGFVLSAVGRAAAPGNPVLAIAIGLGIVLIVAGGTALVGRLRRSRQPQVEPDRLRD